jgi:hypothetical protein
MNRLAASLLFASLATACADGSTTPANTADSGGRTRDGGVPDSVVIESLALTAINPTGGPQEGGTVVVLSGTGFEEGATVRFGDLDATGVAVSNSRSLRATAPAGDGVVSVTITNPDGEAKTLTDAYTYRAPIVDAVDWCAIQFPATLATAPGEQAGPVFARAFEESCTEGEATCGRIVAELGYGPLEADASQTPEQWTWAPAAVNPAHTADNNDEFSASLTVGLPGDYGYAYRMRVNDGAWTYCDLDGTDNGFAPDQVGWLSVQEGVQSLGWCALHAPAATATEPGVETEGIYGRLFVAGCTEGDAACGVVQAELGWGDPQVDPSVTPDAWRWQAAAYNDGHTADDNDEHQATLTPPEAGTFAYAYRVTLDGEAWTYCDLDGTDNGFQLDQAGQLTVAEDTAEVTWCDLHFPNAAEATVGQETLVFGRAFVAGCTEGDAQCPVLQGQLGYGAGDDPAGFTWTDAVYNPEHTVDDNDEHFALLADLDEGSYRYAYRFSVDGEAWTLCDLDGSDNGFAPEQMGTLVVDDPVLSVDWCQLRFPEAIELEVGDPSPLVYARALVPGCTEGDQHCEPLRGQLGLEFLGPQLGMVEWFDAEYNAAHTADDNDEWQASLPANLGAGDYHYRFRFSLDGESWLDCDLDGSDNGFDAQSAGALTVTEPVVAPELTVGWCQVQHPAATSTAPGMSTEPIYGRVFVEGCTEGEGRCEAVTAQVGYGPEATLPNADWAWGPAEHNPALTEANDEHAGVVTVPEVGTYGYGYRFSADDGATWRYCDTDGANSDGADEGLLQASVPQATVAARAIGWCNIQFPAELAGVPGDGVGPVYSRVFVEGCTEGANRCWGLRMQTGLGAAGSDPRVDEWRWFEGAYNPEHSADNNDEFSANLSLSDGHAVFAVRYSGDGGASWTYCDTDGGAFSLEALGAVVVP